MIKFRIENAKGPTLVHNPLTSFERLQRYIEHDTSKDASYHLWVDYGQSSHDYFTFSRKEALSKSVRAVILEDTESVITTNSPDISLAWKMDAQKLKDYLEEIEYLENLGI